MARIKAITAVPEEGQIYTGKVVSILEFGAFVEFMAGRDGLLHISEISWDRLESMEASGLHEGDEVTVKLIEIDKKTGKFRLSMRALQEKPEGYEERRQGGGNRGPRGNGGNGGNRGPRPNGGNRPMGGGNRPNGPRRPNRNRRDDRRDDE